MSMVASYYWKNVVAAAVIVGDCLDPLRCLLDYD